MFTRKKKVGSKMGALKPENRLLELLRSNYVSLGSPFSPANADREDAYSEDPRIVRNAQREIEDQNAKTLLAFRRNQRFC